MIRVTAAVNIVTKLIQITKSLLVQPGQNIGISRVLGYFSLRLLILLLDIIIYFVLNGIDRPSL